MKKRVRLTESQFRSLVGKCVKRVLNEGKVINNRKIFRPGLKPYKHPDKYDLDADALKSGPLKNAWEKYQKGLIDQKTLNDTYNDFVNKALPKRVQRADRNRNPGNDIENELLKIKTRNLAKLLFKKYIQNEIGPIPSEIYDMDGWDRLEPYEQDVFVNAAENVLFDGKTKQEAVRYILDDMIEHSIFERNKSRDMTEEEEWYLFNYGDAY